jgi:hypothetical protein
MPTSKKNLLALSTLTLLLFVSTITFSKEPDESGPSSTVENSFSQKFPNAKNVKWDATSSSKKVAYVEFVFEKKKCRAYFDKEGNILEIQKEIKTKDLPEKVLASLENTYPSEKILNVYEIQKSGKKPVYEIVIKMESEKTSLTINPEGLFTMR